MENFQTQYMPEEHGLIVTDVRFRPNSSQLATSSFDRTIKLWNAADVRYVCLSYRDHRYYAIIPPIIMSPLSCCIPHYCTSTLLRYVVFLFSVHGCKSSYIIVLSYCHHVSNCSKAQPDMIELACK